VAAIIYPILEAVEQASINFEFHDFEVVMTGSVQETPPSLPPHIQLIQIGTGGAVANVVHIAAAIGLADELADGPKSAAEVADPLALHAPSLHRLMRTMASPGDARDLEVDAEAEPYSRLLSKDCYSNVA
jgi:hypothetical protein